MKGADDAEIGQLNVIHTFPLFMRELQLLRISIGEQFSVPLSNLLLNVPLTTAQDFVPDEQPRPFTSIHLPRSETSQEQQAAGA